MSQNKTVVIDLAIAKDIQAFLANIEERLSAYERLKVDEWDVHLREAIELA